MRHDLAESLYAAFVFRTDPVLRAGAWEDGTPLSNDDLAWLVALGHIMRAELFGTVPPAERTPAEPTESELRAMHGDR